MKNLYRLLCLSLSAVALAAMLTSCKLDNKEETVSEAPTVTVLKSAENIEEEINGVMTYTEKGYSFDKKFYAERSLIKGEKNKYILDVYLAETDELNVEIMPSDNNFSKFSWDAKAYKITVYTGDTPVAAYSYDGRDWKESVI